jgi:2,4-dienoyl-CoA reductase (NADPH2)
MASREATALRYAFSPLAVRGRTMRNRFVHAPMSVGYADHKGRATRSMAEHYGRRAQGGAGMVITENVAVSATGRQMPKQPMLAEAVAVERFAEVAHEIKRHGALAVMQVVHAGRYAGPWDVYDHARRLAPSAISFPLLPGREVTPAEITAKEITQSLREFARTASLAEAAGFDRDSCGPGLPDFAVPVTSDEPPHRSMGRRL